MNSEDAVYQPVSGRGPAVGGGSTEPPLRLKYKKTI